MEIRLPPTEPDKLRAAVRMVLERQRAEMPPASVSQERLLGRLPARRRLQLGAEESAKEETEDRAAAEYFQSLLEIAYLVASADGLDLAEREALALLVETVTRSAVDRETLRVHFADLDATSDALGRRERLGRVAANFDDFISREEAIGFAALVAIADGVVAAPEMRVLRELGEHFSLSEEEVRVAAEQVARSVERELAG